MILTTVLLLTFGSPVDYQVENKCTHVPQFVVENKTTWVPPSKREQLKLADGLYEKGSDGTFRKVSGAPAVAPATNFPGVAGGCGCTASRNCGAAFCKSKGGTGCPTSCPVKKQ